MGCNRVIIRCPWPKTDLDIAYHDTEWGVPVHDAVCSSASVPGHDAGRFELVAHPQKRENFRAAFDQFDPNKNRRYQQRKSNGCWPIPASSAIA